MRYFNKSVVFKAGTEGYAFYRIPVLLIASNGDILAFAEGRRASRSDTGVIDIVLRTSTDCGKTWSP